MTEAKATLPMLDQHNARLDDVIAALNLQQIRLKHDQQVPVWEPNLWAGSKLSVENQVETANR
ncbi:MAG: hypothetical protein WBF50_07550 [Pseudolabrys sp.]